MNEAEDDENAMALTGRPETYADAMTPAAKGSANPAISLSTLI